MSVGFLYTQAELASTSKYYPCLLGTYKLAIILHTYNKSTLIHRRIIKTGE